MDGYPIRRTILAILLVHDSWKFHCTSSAHRIPANKDNQRNRRSGSLGRCWNVDRAFSDRRTVTYCSPDSGSPRYGRTLQSNMGRMVDHGSCICRVHTALCDLLKTLPSCVTLGDVGGSGDNLKSGRFVFAEVLLILVIIISVSVALASTLYVTQFQTSSGFHDRKFFTLVAENWGYNQTFGGPALRVRLGDMVTITLIVPGQLAHNLRINEYGLLIGGEFGLRRGENQTMSFVANEVGTFRYYCQTSIYGGHAELGQEGLMIVEPVQ